MTTITNIMAKLRQRLRLNRFVRKHLIVPRMRRLIKATPSPRRLIIEPFNVCNFACPKCLYPGMERPKASLDPALFRRFLVNWRERYGSFSQIEFTGAGEVLVLKSFGELIGTAAEIMPECHLATTTNLYLLDRERADVLVSSGLRRWQVSLDTIDPDRYRDVTGTGADISRTLENLAMLFQTLERHPSPRNELVVVVHYFSETESADAVRDIVDRIAPICHRVQTAPYNSLNGRLEDGDYLASEEKSYARTVAIPCEYLWKDLVVVSNGDVRLCCVDMFDSSNQLGNIFTDTVEEILANRTRLALQQVIYNCDYGRVPLCSRCHAPFY